ncbi:MAG: DNA-processing protein DprA [Xanthomonadales bacterium]|nr:DNA-processing protein DprA [Xanthomonadales bacterium]
MDNSTELPAWLCLLRAPGLGQARMRGLLDAHQSASAAVAAILGGHASPNVSSAARAWLRHPDAKCIDADLAWLDEPGHHLLRCTEADFPPQLDNIDAAPAALFIAGDASLLLRPQVAIVGARGASAQGLADAREFARQFAHAGLVVTSGMADGIDGAAHQSTLEAGGLSIGVLGTGVDRVYPRKHRDLAQALAEHGALVSELPLGTGARASHFPQRNRLIAGLSLATVVIEAGLRSGSLITARQAAEQGREVFVLPGSVHSPLKSGCHRLIRDGARLVEDAHEVLEALGPAAQALGIALAARLDAADDHPGPIPAATVPDGPQQQLLAALGHDPSTLDELALRTGLSASSLSAMLLLLELDGRVASQPGNHFQRLP